MKIYRHMTANSLVLDPFPFPRELAMEAYLAENENILELDDDAFSGVEIIDMELGVEGGRSSHNKNGRIDLLITYSQTYIGVVELKLGQIDQHALGQLEDYLKNKANIVNKDHTEALGVLAENSNQKWVGVLVGSDIAPEIAAKLANGLTSESIPIAALVIKRFRGSDGSVYVTSDRYFSFKPSKKDYTKYVFNGKSYSKGRLVLEVVRDYVHRNPTTNFAKLIKVFPKNLQGSLGVFETECKAKECYETSGYKRYYINASDLIALEDSTIAVCNQWGISNIKLFISHANKLLNEQNRPLIAEQVD